MHIEIDKTLAIEVMLSSEGTIAAFERAVELCLMYSPRVTGLKRSGRGDVCLCSIAEVFA